MSKLLAIIKISRPINFLITFFAVIISAQISLEQTVLNTQIFLGALTMAFACSAGNVINDIFDLEIDKINKPSRMLPSEKLTVGFTKILYSILLILSMAFSVFNGFISVLFLLIVNLALVLYSTKFKKIIFVGNLVVALLTASALIYGALIVNNIVGGIIPAIFAFLSNLIRELIKDMEDVKGDSAKNVITFSNKFGQKKTLLLISTITFLVIAFTFIPFLYKLYRIEFFVIVMTTVNVLFVYMVKLLYKSPKLETLKKASNIVKLNMVVGLFAIYVGVFV